MNLDEHNRSAMVRFLKVSTADQDAEVECPNCTSSLVYTTPTLLLLFRPAQFNVVCRNCGFTGTKVAGPPC